MNNEWDSFNSYLIKQAFDNRVPLMGKFELTSRCNLRCKMCYVRNDPNDKGMLQKELRGEDWIQLAENARDAGMLYLLLTGGEVFLHPDFREIYEAISMMGLNVSIYSNGTMITPELARWLGRKPPSLMRITVYGASPQTYKRVCGFEDGYERALKGIELLRNEGINLEIVTTVIKGNSEDLYKIAEFADRQGLKFGVCSYITPRRDECGIAAEDERLSGDELEKVESFINKLSDKGTDDPLGKNYGELSLMDIHIHNGNSFEITDEAFDCGAGRCSFWITWDGQMVPCGVIDGPSTFPLKSGFIKAWDGLHSLCRSVPVCGECQGCSLKKYCISCPAYLRIETGAYDKPAPYLCELARIRRSLEIGYSKV